jgi:hypothetical protein
MKLIPKLMFAMLALGATALHAEGINPSQPQPVVTELGIKLDQAVAEWRIVRLQATEVQRLAVRALIPLSPRPSTNELGRIAANHGVRTFVSRHTPLAYRPLVYAPSNTFVPMSASTVAKPIAVNCVSGCEALFRVSGAEPVTSSM